MADSDAYSLTVVMPAYNEEGAIREAVREVQQHVLPNAPRSELLVINDGSRDRTGAILEELANQDSRILVIHQPNGGHGRALVNGLEQSKSEYVFLVDSDRQIPLDTFPEFWEVATECDGAFGQRVRRHDPALRLFITALVRWTVKALFGVRIFDPNVPYKIFRRKLWEEAREFIPADTFAPSLHLAIFARVRGFDIVESPIRHRERETGEASIRRWKLFKVLARAGVQLLAFRGSLRGRARRDDGTD
jgi:glycosyltransferase involved in cell wall biosynthesis